MSNLMKFMMTIVALALLMFLNADGAAQKQRIEKRKPFATLPEHKIAA